MSDTPEPNPYESPQANGTTHRRHGGRRVLLIALGLILTPIAAGISFYGCCWAGVVVIGGVIGQAISPEPYSGLMVVLCAGIMLGIAVALLVGWLIVRSIHKRLRAMDDLDAAEHM